MLGLSLLFGRDYYSKKPFSSVSLTVISTAVVFDNDIQTTVVNVRQTTSVSWLKIFAVPVTLKNITPLLICPY